MNGPWWGFFSEQQARRLGSVVYATADGQEVEVTEVSSSSVERARQCAAAYPDATAVVELVRWVRHERPGPKEDRRNVPHRRWR